MWIMLESFSFFLSGRLQTPADIISAEALLESTFLSGRHRGLSVDFQKKKQPLEHKSNWRPLPWKPQQRECYPF